MMDSVDTISGATGLTRKTMNEIWTEVKANSAALDSCIGPHDFQSMDQTKKLGTRYKCSKCGGTVDGVSYSWYTRGLTHGRPS